MQFTIHKYQCATIFDIERRQLTKIISALHQIVVSFQSSIKGLDIRFPSSLTSQDQGQTGLPYPGLSPGFKSTPHDLIRHLPQM